MDEAANLLEFIGLCLAPLEEGRTALLEDSADKVRHWEGALKLSGAKHVSPAVFARLRASGLLRLVPEEIAARFEKVYVAIAAVNALRLHQALTVTAKLAERGVKALYLKGASLVMAGDFPDPGQRMFSDVDLLVDPRGQEEVRDAFAEMGGWREQPSQVMEGWEVTSWIDGFGNELEVHWSLKPYNNLAAGVTERRLFAHAREVDYRGRRALIPSREDRLIQAALHFTIHHYFDSSYFYTGVCDLAHIAAGGGLDWDRLAADLAAERMIEHVMVALELAFGLTRYPSISEAIAELEERSPGLAETCAPLAGSLGRMAMKPWDFFSFYERRLFVRKSLRGWARYISSGLKRRVVPGRVNPGDKARAGREWEGIMGSPAYQRKVFDRDFLRYLYELYRFDRRINFKIKV